jgi:predicted molibdopterin-dependent oxidoreductase YjgC
MLITINKTPVETLNGETLIETARRTGYDIPSLCYVKDAVHKSSCMVCAVKNCATGQILPSCTTFPEEGMHIDTESEEVRTVRTLSLELLLSDHRADCEAPCSMVCPQGLDIERMLNLYDTGRRREAHELIAAAFALPPLGCDNCKVPCEKVCRRGTVDQAVSIRAIIRELAGLFEPTDYAETKKDNHKTDKTLFQSRLGRFTESEKKWIRELNNQQSILNLIQDENRKLTSGCLHCACAGREGCKLRLYATAAGIKRPRYEASSALPAMQKEHVTGNMWFEPAKCIRCGLCVYNSQNGFTFKDRGFGMLVVIPDENKANVGEELVELCPTGALYATIQ